MFYVSGLTLAEAWEQSVITFLKLPDVYKYDSDYGLCLEAQGSTIRVFEPAREPLISDKYLFKPLIEEYQAKLAGKIAQVSTTYERIYHWEKRDKKKLNQLNQITKILQLRPSTRAAVVSLWDPEFDLVPTQSPVSPCIFSFILRDGKLNMSIVARSTDIWIGALPEMVAFSGLQIAQAKKLHVAVGHLIYHAFSYHMYEQDFPIARQTFAVTGEAP